MERRTTQESSEVSEGGEMAGGRSVNGGKDPPGVKAAKFQRNEEMEEAKEHALILRRWGLIWRICKLPCSCQLHLLPDLVCMRGRHGWKYTFLSILLLMCAYPSSILASSCLFYAFARLPNFNCSSSWTLVIPESSVQVLPCPLVHSKPFL